MKHYILIDIILQFFISNKFLVAVLCDKKFIL